MRVGSESLCVRVEEQNRQYGNRKFEAKRIQLPCRAHEETCGSYREQDSERGCELTRWQSSHLRAGILGINLLVSEAIKGHRCTARTHHGHHNPKQLWRFRPAA